MRMLSQDLSSCSEGEDVNDEDQRNDMSAAEPVCIQLPSVNKYIKNGPTLLVNAAGPCCCGRRCCDGRDGAKQRTRQDKKQKKGAAR